MSFTTVILAAGDSTRMPNKALMPTPGMNHYLVSEYAFMFAQMQGVAEKTIVVDRPEQIISTVLWKRNWQFESVIQETAHGVLQAAKLAHQHAEGSHLLILFCDNLYDMRAEVPCAGNYASVREVKNSQLDGFENNKWVGRNRNPKLKFAGWLMLDRDKLEACESSFLIPAMNEIGVQPIECHNKWADVGTHDSFLEVWREGFN